MANNLMALKVMKGVPHLDPLTVPELMVYRDSLIKELHQKEEMGSFAFKLLQKEVVRVNSLIEDLQVQEPGFQTGEAA
ncbi:hypothetical protein [Amycolatopsis magusensis]